MAGTRKYTLIYDMIFGFKSPPNDLEGFYFNFLTEIFSLICILFFLQVYLISLAIYGKWERVKGRFNHPTESKEIQIQKKARYFEEGNGSLLSINLRERN